MLDLDMAQYGPFVWTAWGVSLGVLFGMAARGLVDAARARKALRDLGDEDS